MFLLPICDLPMAENTRIATRLCGKSKRKIVKKKINNYNKN